MEKQYLKKVFLFILITFNLQLVLFVKQINCQMSYGHVNSLPDCIKYLIQFGYLKDVNEVSSLLTPSRSPINVAGLQNPAATALGFALTKFQEYTRLKVTGEFDSETKAKMNIPRCGNKDIIQITTSSLDMNSVVLRQKRYITSSFKWTKRELSYKISKFSTTGFSEEITQREVDKAFEIWANVTNLYFIRSDTATSVDIDLSFEKMQHGDVEQFDGRGLVLAHAFPPGPELGGDIHFDDEEQWSSEVIGGTNFLHVVVHELGHALGLRHSEVEESIMYPFARPYSPSLQLVSASFAIFILSHPRSEKSYKKEFRLCIKLLIVLN